MHHEAVLLPLYGCRKTEADWQDVLHVMKHAEEYGFDIETDTGIEDNFDGPFDVDGDPNDLLRPPSILGFSVCATPGDGLFYSFESDDEAEQLITTGVVVESIQNPQQIKVCTNTKFEKRILLDRYGVDLRGHHDTMLEAYLLGDYPLSLKDGFHKATGIEMIRIDKFSKLGFKKKNPATGKTTVDMRAAQENAYAEFTEYSAQDADASLRLHQYLYPLLRERGLDRLYHDIEIPFVDIVVAMERNGFRFNPAALTEAREILVAARARWEGRLQEILGREINPNSWQQVQQALYRDETPFKIPAPRRKDGKLPTDKTSLAKHAGNELVRSIFTVRAIRKTLGTYIDGLPKWMDADGIIHAEYKQARAATGRMASANPNMQNIPSRKREDVDVEIEGSAIRKAFTVRDPNNFIVAPDLSQIEMRIAAHVSQDEIMIRELTDPNGDIHSTAAARIYGKQEHEVEPTVWKNMRYLAKTCNFGVLYGLTAEGLLARTPTLNLTIQQARDFIDGIYDTFPKLRPHQHSVVAYTRKHGYARTILGRRRYFPDITASDPKFRAEAERGAINHEVQGSAADFFKVAVLNVANWLQENNLRTFMIAQVHDELVLEAPEDELDILYRNVPKLMGEALPLAVPVPVDFEYGKVWGDLKKYKAA